MEKDLENRHDSFVILNQTHYVGFIIRFALLLFLSWFLYYQYTAHEEAVYALLPLSKKAVNAIILFACLCIPSIASKKITLYWLALVLFASILSW